MSSKVLPAIAEDAEKISPRILSIEKGEDFSKKSKTQQLPQIPTRAISEDIAAQSKAQWENQIAKHILTLFASSQVVEKYSEGKALMEFVEGDDNEEINNNTEHNKSKIVLSQLKKPRKKKPKDIVKKAPIVVEEDPRKEDIKMIKGLQKRILKEEEEDDEYGNKYRTNTIIKSKTGEDIIVRGQPKCYPIWFVSSGEVYSDWSGLPGGKKLQAQLNNLYEKRQFMEYLGVLEKLLVGLWREIIYGESAKQLMMEPKFGITAEYAGSSATANTKAASTGSIMPDEPGNFLKKDKHPSKESSPNSNPNFGSVLSWSADGHVHVSAANPHPQANPQGGLRTHTHTHTHNHGDKAKSDRVVAHGGVLKSDSEVGKPNLSALTEFWKLLVLTSNAMGVLSVERKQFELAMDIFRKAEEWVDECHQYLRT